MKKTNFILGDGTTHYWFNLSVNNFTDDELYRIIDDALSKYYGVSCSIGVRICIGIDGNNSFWVNLSNQVPEHNYDLITLRRIINDAICEQFASMDEADINPIGNEVIVTAPSHIRVNTAYLSEVTHHLLRYFDNKSDFTLALGDVTIDEDGEHIRIASPNCEDMDAVIKAFDAFNAENAEKEKKKKELESRLASLQEQIEDVKKELQELG